MIKYAKIIDQQKKLVDVLTYDNERVAKKEKMVKMEVEQGFDSNWYVKGFAPKESEESKTKKEVLELERQTGYTRVLREIISKTDVSKEVKDIANKIEKVAIKLRK